MDLIVALDGALDKVHLMMRLMADLDSALDGGHSWFAIDGALDSGPFDDALDGCT